jgi:hypothetical protein
MTCPHCESTATTGRSDRTELGYHRFRGRVFNGRAGPPLTRLQYPTDRVGLGHVPAHARQDHVLLERDPIKAHHHRSPSRHPELSREIIPQTADE